jgi:glucose/arabinose dehydrogenase
MGSHRGKILRADVNNSQLGTWSVPADNPFVSDVSGRLGEIWVSGFANPWLFSFDSQTGGMFIRDVRILLKETYFLPASSTGGENFGWCVCQGIGIVDKTGVFEACAAPDDFDSCSTTYVPPIIQYPDENNASSVIGGYVYRGTAYPAFDRTYFYADFTHDFIRGAQFNSVTNTWTPAALSSSSSSIVGPTSFSQAANEELYVGTLPGELYHLQDQNVPNPPCSATGSSS